MIDQIAWDEMISVLVRTRLQGERLSAVLGECREYFDQRADIAEYSDETGHTPNDELRLLQEIDAVLSVKL